MKLAITQRRSAIGRRKDQKETIAALGLKRLHQQVVHEDSAQLRGMVMKVGHLLEVREIGE
jgi:large subunit ribosomal protein L30